MKLTRSLVGWTVIFSIGIVSFATVPVRTVSAQDATAALQRGYRTGYSDGYMSGYRDTIDGEAKDYTAHNEYYKADRAYSKDYGDLDDYRDGYQQGYETGYEAGYQKLSFESVLPSGLAVRGLRDAAAAVKTTEANAEASAPPAPATESAAAAPTGSVEPAASAAEATSPIQPAGYAVGNAEEAVIVVPRDTELIVELNEPITTSTAKEGDKFTAKVVSPAEFSGATIEGRVDKIQRPGRIKRRSEMLLSFDRIIISERRWSNFDAALTEVLPVKGDNVRRVDAEGLAVGKSSIKPDAAKVGAATGVGAGVGAVAGGPVGAAVGAGVGAAFGVGAVVIERGKDLQLNRGQQLRIKTSYETQIR